MCMKKSYFLLKNLNLSPFNTGVDFICTNPHVRAISFVGSDFVVSTFTNFIFFVINAV